MAGPRTPPDVSRDSPAQRGQRATPLVVAVRIAARQRGAVTRAQLLAAGVSGSAIDRLVAAGALVRVHRGVFVIGPGPLTIEAAWMAAVLAGGEGAVLSHRSAAAAWGLRADARSATDITVRNRTGFRQPRLTPHECRLTAADVVTIDGMPVTTVARTLLDLAEVVPYRQLHRAAEESMHLRLFDAGSILALLRRSPGRRGQRPLRRFLVEAVDEPAVKRSTLEILALELADRVGLRPPLVNTMLHGKEVDLLWRTERVAVELDGWGAHGHRLAFERDRDRDSMLAAEGYVVLRFTWRQVTDRPNVVVERVLRTLARRAAR